MDPQFAHCVRPPVPSYSDTHAVHSAASMFFELPSHTSIADAAATTQHAARKRTDNITVIYYRRRTDSVTSGVDMNHVDGR